ncbi:MAG: hypothetical protein HXY34_05520 [Candidatus Thorarchaeota archaeon]|nr:hypothetical protein [Candidatus Thorarchaeota archaeon]
MTDEASHTRSSHIDRWLRVFNGGQRNSGDTQPLIQQDLVRLVRDRVVDFDALHLSTRRRTPVAACRLSVSPVRGSMALADLAYLPGERESAESLMEVGLAKAREQGLSELVMWVSEKATAIADMTACFCFEARKIRARYVRTLAAEGEPPTGEQSCRTEPATGPGRLSQLLLGGVPSLTDLVSEWKSPFTVAVKDTDVSVSVYESEDSRRECWIHFHSKNPTDCRMSISVSTLEAVLALLYRRGVRNVNTEVCLDHHLNDSLSQAGFELVTTYYEMVMSLQQAED